MPHDQHDLYASPMGASPSTFRLNVERIASEHRIPRGVIEGMRAEYGEDPAGNVAIRLCRDLITEKLPPATMEDVVQFTVPRFSTWFDHFCATYRGKWWGWLLGLDLREIRYRDENWSHRTTVQVLSRWTYPEYVHPAPADRFGPVVMRADAYVYDSGIMPW